MGNANKDILTTAETARLLGVSTRTAQLLIEGGSVPSWKTPGGHRRVYRADVIDIIEGKDKPSDARAPSAIVVVIAAAARLPAYKHAFARTGEFTVEGFEDVLAALLAVGSLQPFAIVVDAEPDGPDRAPLLRSLAATTAIANSKLLLVGDPARSATDLHARTLVVSDAEAAREALLASLVEQGDAVVEEMEQGVPTALNEAQRLVALERSGLLGTGSEDAFDRLTWLASQMLCTPIALLTLLTPARQWFKSRVGLDMTDTPRSWAFCNHTIMQREVFAVDNLADDPRFADNPAVRGEPGFRFYAGAPVVDEDGFVVGSLCVIDRSPRTIDERGIKTIEVLAAIASDELKLRSLKRGPRSEPVVKRAAIGKDASRGMMEASQA